MIPQQNTEWLRSLDRRGIDSRPLLLVVIWCQQETDYASLPQNYSRPAVKRARPNGGGIVVGRRRIAPDSCGQHAIRGNPHVLPHRCRRTSTACDSPVVDRLITRGGAVDGGGSCSMMSTRVPAAAASKNPSGVSASSASNDPPASIASLLASWRQRGNTQLRSPAATFRTIVLPISSEASPRI